MLQVFSVFKSLQGESTFAGLPCAFIRLAGCPLKCSYCDTREACDADGEPVSIDQLVEQIKSMGIQLVEVTGGEPLFQKETPALLRALCDAGLLVLLETSGAYTVRGIDPRVRVILDVKCPDSGMKHTFLEENLRQIAPSSHELKFVISSKKDFEWAEMFVRSRKMKAGIECLISPVEKRVSCVDAAQWVLESDCRFRLQLQLHKIIWGDESNR